MTVQHDIEQGSAATDTHPQRRWLRARYWWATGVISSVVLSLVVLQETPVQYQATVRVESTSDVGLDARGRGELLTAVSSSEVLRRVEESVSRSDSGVSVASGAVPEAQAKGWVALGDFKFRAAGASPNAVYVVARGAQPEPLLRLAMIVTESAVATVLEHRLGLVEEERGELTARIAVLSTRAEEIRQARIVEYGALIQRLVEKGSRLTQEGASAAERRAVDIELQAAVLQRAQLESGLPLSGSQSTAQLLGPIGLRLRASEARLVQLEETLSEPASNWSIRQDLNGPLRRLPRTVALAMVAAFFVPLSVVGVARLLIEIAE